MTDRDGKAFLKTQPAQFPNGAQFEVADILFFKIEKYGIITGSVCDVFGGRVSCEIDNRYGKMVRVEEPGVLDIQLFEGRFVAVIENQYVALQG